MTSKISRRSLISAIGVTPLAACADAPGEALRRKTERGTGRFAHGVASGDPTANAVILWTRITPDDATQTISVTWEISETEDFAQAKSGEVETTAAQDFTVKIDATDLKPGQVYYYCFHAGATTSPIGRTKTLPQGNIDSARFAVVSCANYQQGFFNAYDHIARQDHFDALIHLGDYFYEYGASETAVQGRQHQPAHEILSLEDYRTRHAQYRSDASTQAVTKTLPMISIWDDHESANDSWRTGAENHNDGEGDWEDRKRVALRAYYEWMPIREPKPGRMREMIYRHYDYGNLLTLLTLETRLLARSEPLVIDDYFDMIREDGGVSRFKPILDDPSRDMLGAEQLDWAVKTLADSKSAGISWRLIAQQVVIGRVTSPDLTPHVTPEVMEGIAQAWPGVREFVEFSQYGLPTYADSWDGYPAARNQFYDAVREAGVKDLLVITGDSHEFWVNDLTDKDGTSMGVELGTTSVSSDTLAAYMGSGAEDYALLMTQANPDVRYYNPMLSGYIDLKLGQRKGTARLISLDTVKSENYTAQETARFSLRPTRDGSIKVTAPKGLNLKQRALFSGLG